MVTSDHGEASVRWEAVPEKACGDAGVDLTDHGLDRGEAAVLEAAFGLDFVGLGGQIPVVPTVFVLRVVSALVAVAGPAFVPEGVVQAQICLELGADLEK